MKKKMLAFLLAVSAALVGVFGLAGCDLISDIFDSDNQSNSGNQDSGDNQGDSGIQGGIENNETHTHTLIHHDANAPTCTESGNVEYWSCSSCNKNFSDGNGNKYIQNVIIKAKGHTEVVDKGVATTCTENGKTKGKHCSVCNTVIVEQTLINAKGHHYVNGMCTSCKEPQPASTGLNYTLNTDNGSYSLSALGTCTDKDIIISSVYEGKPVTAINSNVFSGNTKITSVIIPDSITSIGLNAFSGCTKLTDVMIGKGVTNIGERAFYKCSGLMRINIPKNVKSVGGAAFFECERLSNITVSNVNINIDSSAFNGCSNIYYATIPTTIISKIPKNSLSEVIINGGYSIDDGAFNNCTALTHITLSDTVKHITFNAINGCSKLQYNSYDNAQYLGTTNNDYYALVMAKSNDITSCSINDNTKIVADSAFASCSSLQYKSYDNARYLGTRNNPYFLLSKVTARDISSCNIHSSTKIIASAAFSSCDTLTSISIPNNVEVIGLNAFAYCSELASVTLGNKLVAIGDSAFYRCTKLVNIAIPDSVTSIEQQAFMECGLKSVILPDSLTSIARATFYDCENLTSITISSNVTSIGYQVFNGCNRLTTVTFKGTKTQWKTIEKNKQWNYDTGKYTIVCTDGKLNKYGSEIE